MLRKAWTFVLFQVEEVFLALGMLVTSVTDFLGDWIAATDLRIVRELFIVFFLFLFLAFVMGVPL